jgi:cytochrome c-type biogenesis protein
MVEVGLLSAFIAGVLSFASPCVLPLVPVYIGIISSRVVYKSDKIKFSDRLYIFLNSIFFVAGFSVVFIILGSTATFIGQLLRNYMNIIGRIGGVKHAFYIKNRIFKLFCVWSGIFFWMGAMCWYDIIRNSAYGKQV